MTLVEFLLARIAEDEAAALAASALPGQWDEAAREHIPVPGEPAVWIAGDGYGSGAVERTNGAPRDVGIVVYDEGSPNEAEAAHIARHDPARVLAECEAKRRIVASYVERDASHDTRSPDYWDVPIVLEHLASVYADHPDCDQAWRP